jgi:hypothetical protein
MRTYRIAIIAIVLIFAIGTMAFALGQSYWPGMRIGVSGLTVRDGAFTLQTSGQNSRFAIARNTGLVTSAPQLTTSGVGWTVTPTVTTATGILFDFSTLTTGDGLKLKFSTPLTGTGAAFNVYDGTSSVFKICDAGAITATGTITETGAVAQTQTNAAGGSANPWDYTATLGIMNGSDDFTLFDVNITNADHTGSGNTVQVMDIAGITGDAHATETAIKIGAGWDTGITTSSPIALSGATSGGITIAPIATGTAVATIQNQNVAASTITLPSATCTLPGLQLSNAFTGANSFASTVTGPGGGSAVYHKYSRITVATINAAGATGVELLPAVAGRQYQIVNATLTAYGGAFTSTNATSLEIVSDPAGTPVVLYQVLKAQLAQGTTAGVGMNSMKPCTASTVLLANNASFVAQVAGKAIYLITTTPSTYDWATATGVDVEIEYIVI